MLIPGWVGVCKFQDPVGLSSGLLCEAGSFSRCLNPHRCFQSEVWGFISPLEPWVVGLSHSPFVPPGLSARECGTPGPPAATLLRVLSAQLPISTPPAAWVSVSSSAPWLSDFHTVQFSVSYGCFLFLNLLLSFFWLCKEVQCVYLCLHLGQKSEPINIYF